MLLFVYDTFLLVFQLYWLIQRVYIYSTGSINSVCSIFFLSGVCVGLVVFNIRRWVLLIRKKAFTGLSSLEDDLTGKHSPCRVWCLRNSHNWSTVLNQLAPGILDTLSFASANHQCRIDGKNACTANTEHYHWLQILQNK